MGNNHLGGGDLSFKKKPGNGKLVSKNEISTLEQLFKNGKSESKKGKISG